MVRVVVNEGMTRDTVLITIDCFTFGPSLLLRLQPTNIPNVDSLSSEGLQYERSYSNGPGTRFAFRSLLGGVHPLRLNGAGLPESEKKPRRSLLEAGYQTAGFANNPFLTTYFGYDRGSTSFEMWITGNLLRMGNRSHSGG